MGLEVASAQHAIHNIQHSSIGGVIAAGIMMQNPNVSNNAGQLTESYDSRNIATETPIEMLNTPSISANASSKDNSIA